MPSPSSLRALAAIVAAAAVLAGCGAGDAGAPRWVAETDTIGDTIVVRTVSGGVWPAGVTVVPEVTIGKFEGEDEYIFGEIVALTVAADGSIFLYDRHAKALRQYAPDGTYVRTIGREGGWPGEYRRPDAGLTITPDGRLPASPCCGSRRRDPRARRIGGEGRDGAPRYGEHALHRPELALRRARHPGHQARVPLLFVAADGRIWVQTHQPAFEIEAEEETGEPRPGRRTPQRWVEPLVYDVFEPDGRYLGAIELPRNTSVRYARGEHIWASTRDELDVQYVTRFRIQTDERISDR
ncbi:MAG TPA: hypothetical protein VKZ85_13015 [Woeseiaceae bacterium]|nr:hypothetical protein [Woeseiaceae bacterium]